MDSTPPINTVSSKTSNKRHLFFQAGLSISIILTFSLSFFAKTTNYFWFDLIITQAIQKIQNPFFQNLMVFVSELGNSPVVVILPAAVIIFALSLKRYQDGLIIFLSSYGILVLTGVLKLIIDRPRPDPALIQQLYGNFHGGSFPSGHVLSFMGFYGILYFLIFTRLKKSIFRTVTLFVCLVLMILIGLSRIYLGAHWFSDVFGAYLIGLLWLYLMSYLYKKIKFS